MRVRPHKSYHNLRMNNILVLNLINQKMSNLRIKQLTSCPYISFKFMNLMSMLIGIITIAVAILLFLELHTAWGLYTYGYLIVGLAELAISIMSFKKADTLLMMGRQKRKVLLQLLIIIKSILFIAHLVISISLWLNFNVLS